MKTIKRIPHPKFRVGRFVLNEYELRCLILEVAQGDKPEFIGSVVRDESGCSATITETGALSDRLPGLHIASEYALKHMAIKNKNREF